MRTWWLLALLLTGCAAGITETRAQFRAVAPADHYACEQEATRAGSAWLDASPLWRHGLGTKSTGELYADCLRARGY